MYYSNAINYQYGSGAIGEWTVNDVSVTCNPTYVSGTPVNVARMIIENVFEGRRGVN